MLRVLSSGDVRSHGVNDTRLLLVTGGDNVDVSQNLLSDVSRSNCAFIFLYLENDFFDVGVLSMIMCIDVCRFRQMLHSSV